MCLFTVDPVTRHYTEGYKIFLVDQFHAELLVSEFYNKYYKMEVNEWIEDDNNCMIRSQDDCLYQSGFHFFINLEDAKRYAKGLRLYHKIIKVLVKNCVASGTQYVYFGNSRKKAEVGVARSMKILEGNCI